MLHRKQKCLALNSLGLYCGCQALSNGRCHEHSPFLSTPAVPARRPATNAPRGLFASFSVWRELLGPAFGSTMRHTPAAFNL